jgi:hypothetical protein
MHNQNAKIQISRQFIPLTKKPWTIEAVVQKITQLPSPSPTKSYKHIVTIIGKFKIKQKVIKLNNTKKWSKSIG